MEFELDALQSGFIAPQVLPVVETAKQSGNFGKIPVEQLLKERETLRAPGAGYARGKFTFTSDSFACDEHGAEEPVDDREADMYADYFDAELIAAARARRAVLVNAEKRAAAAIFNATTWTSYTTGITNEWDDSANAVPLTDVESAVQAVWDQCGIWPNAMIINRKVFRNLRNCAQIIDRVKYQGMMDARAGNITVAALQQAFDLDNIIVAGSARDSALEGQSTSIAPIWSDEYAMICRVASSADIREPCVGRIFHWGEDGSSIGGTMETYRDETVRSNIVRCRHDVDEKVLYVEAGHLLSNITT
jgi:hypothetical protein